MAIISQALFCVLDLERAGNIPQDLMLHRLSQLPSMKEVWLADLENLWPGREPIVTNMGRSPSPPSSSSPSRPNSKMSMYRRPNSRQQQDRTVGRLATMTPTRGGVRQTEKSSEKPRAQSSQGMWPRSARQCPSPNFEAASPQRPHSASKIMCKTPREGLPHAARQPKLSARRASALKQKSRRRLAALACGAEAL